MPFTLINWTLLSIPRLYDHCLTSASQNGWYHRSEVQDTREEHMFFTLCTRVTIPLKIFFLQKR